MGWAYSHSSMVGVGYQCRPFVFFAVSRRPRRWDPTSHGRGALKPEPWELPALPAPGADHQPAGGLSAGFGDINVKVLTNFRIKKATKCRAPVQSSISTE